MDRDRKLAIWGAGKIGRGLVAELFQRAGWELILVDTDPALISRLRAEGVYRIIKTYPDGSGEIEKITRYRSFLPSDPVLVEEFSAISLLAVCVPQSALAAAARGIAAGLHLRAATAPQDPVDILLAGDYSAATFRECLNEFLSDRTRSYVSERVGFVDTIVLRMFEPTVDLTGREPLTLVTNGFPSMPADKFGFKRPPLDVPGLILTESVRAEQVRKWSTCDMLQALLGYVGQNHRHWYAHEALGDPVIERVALGALKEAGRALVREHGFATEEMDGWILQVLRDAGNPFVRFRTARLTAHPINHVSRDGPLTGTALMCRRNGVTPENLAQAIAHAFVSADPVAPQAVEIQQQIAQRGIEAAVRRLCGLDEETDIVEMVTSAYQEACRREPT